MTNRLSKILKQMKEDLHKKPNANDAVMSLFSSKKTVAEEFREELHKLASHFEIDGAKESALSLVKKVNEKLDTVPYIQYPVSFSTVDVLPVQGSRVLLIRKHGQTQFQICGGFRDPKESGEQAAARELEEETGVWVESHRMQYIGSMFIDDNRYKDSCHKITTNIFITEMTPTEASYEVAPTDKGEIAETMWFDLNIMKDDWFEIVRPVHQNLFKFIVEDTMGIQLKPKPNNGTDTVQDVLPGNV